MFSLYKVGFEGRRQRFPSLLDCTLIAARIAAMYYFHVALIVPHICETLNHVESSKQYTVILGKQHGLGFNFFYVLFSRPLNLKKAAKHKEMEWSNIP